MKKNSGFAPIETVLILLVALGVILTGWYVWHAKQTADKTLNANNSSTPIYSKRPTKQSTNSQLPEGYTWYQGDGFKFAYPEAYGEFSVSKDANTDSESVQIWRSGSSKIALFAGLLDDEFFSLNEMKSTDVPIGMGKYGPIIKLDNGKWVVAKDSLPDTMPYKTGDIYTYVTATKNTGTTIYTFTPGDEGIISHVLAFTVKGHLCILNLPRFDTGSFLSEHPNDQKPYDQLAQQIAKSITVE